MKSSSNVRRNLVAIRFPKSESANFNIMARSPSKVLK